MQNILIQEWLDNPVNRELYFQWLEEWESENPQFTPDVEPAYQRSLYIVQQDNDTPEAFPPAIKTGLGSLIHQLFVFRWVAAASVAVILGAYLLSDFWLYTHYETGYGEIRMVRLPDSSRVILNANSILTIPRFGFGSGTREVLLKGEAEFAVKHTTDHRKFVVRTPDKLEVRVLGTEFIVYSRDRGLKVVLSQGSVQLRSLNDLNPKPDPDETRRRSYAIDPGRINVSHSQSLFRHQAWKQHRFMFENTSVSKSPTRSASISV